MTCKICTQLEEAAEAAKRPDPPEILQGLNESGLRNRARQREEKQVKTALDLEKHQRTCPEYAKRPAF
jgi:hypothetical protein